MYVLRKVFGKETGQTLSLDKFYKNSIFRKQNRIFLKAFKYHFFSKLHHETEKKIFPSRNAGKRSPERKPLWNGGMGLRSVG